MKVFFFRDKRFQEYREDTLGKGSFYALCVVNPLTGDIKWYDHQGRVDGEAKVKNFILQRLLYLSNRNIVESELSFEVDMIEQVFTSDWFNENKNEWVKGVWDLRNLPDPKNYTTKVGGEGANLMEITPASLLEHLENPSKRETEEVKWGGKILAEPMCSNIRTESHTDQEMVTLFLSSVGDCEELKRIKELWDKDHNCFSLIDKKDLDKPENEKLSSLCGWRP